MDERRIQLAIGALLHDFGKLLYRYNDRRSHSVSGHDYLKNELGVKEQEVLEQVYYHHLGLLKDAKIEKNSLAYITYIADNIASSSDRREKEDSNAGFSPTLPLESIFNLLNENDENYVYQPTQLDEIINYPSKKVKEYNKEFYGKIVGHLRENLRSIAYTTEYFNSLLELLEVNLSYVPSSTNKKEVADISLYDHIKLTSAFALCIYSWLEENGIEDYEKELLKGTSKFYKKKAFLLFSMDMSGIQDFIYTIASKDALKSLRSRSFYLELLMEDFIDELIQKTDVTRANLLYSGGGHAYLMLPNTEKVKEKINEFEKECNEWLLEQFNTALFLACGYKECSKEELHNKPEGSYREIFKAVSSMIAEKKVHRYSAKQIVKLNQRIAKHQIRECKVCRTSDNLTKEDICRTCDALIKMSNHILNKGFYGVTTKSDIKPSLPLPYGKYLIAQSQQELLKNLKEQEISQIYTKNESYIGWNIAKRLWVGDYTNGETFEELAKGAEGIERIAVLRADVDNLGNAFLNGFSSKKYGEQYMTISRTATFSRKMSMFFKYHINSILKCGDCYIGEKQKRGERKVTIVYSGGDDIFVVGSWDEVIGFAIDLRESFERFSQGTLTISAGIGIYPGKYPVSTMAKQTGELEEKSKQYSKNGKEKDAITLFEEGLTFSWEELEEDIIDVKLDFLKRFFKHMGEKEALEKGKAFLYRMLELIRNMEEDKINLARLAYLLARLEEMVDKKNSDVGKLDIQDFSHQIYKWIREPEERKRLIVAIYLYVYLMRENKQ